MPVTRKHKGQPVPSFEYTGGKCLLRDWLVRYFPRQCKTYCEPFAGRANVFFLAASVMKAESWWLNDIQTVPFLQALMKVDLSQLPERIGVDEVDEWMARIKAKDPVALVVEPSVTWGGSGVVSRGFFYGDGRHFKSHKDQGKPPHYLRSRDSRTIMAAKEVLARTHPRLTGLDYLEVLSQLEAGDFCYLDPPYYDADVQGYTDGGLNHVTMAKELAGADYMWILSEYDHEIYWDILGPPSATKKAVASRSKTCVRRRECLWHNAHVL